MCYYVHCFITQRRLVNSNSKTVYTIKINLKDEIHSTRGANVMKVYQLDNIFIDFPPTYMH